MLKKTKEYSEQASKLELEYDRLLTEDGVSKDPALAGKAAVIQKGDITIPKLDLSVVFLQRDANSDENENGEEEEEESDDPSTP